jgi:hypothetical protein
MISLRQLDGKRVGVSIPLKEPPVWVHGTAVYETQAEVPQLKITIQDDTGSFDILIKEADWNGTIEQGSPGDQAEFLIRLKAPVANQKVGDSPQVDGHGGFLP